MSTPAILSVTGILSILQALTIAIPSGTTSLFLSNIILLISLSVSAIVKVSGLAVIINFFSLFFKNLLNKLSDKKILILGRNQKDIYEYIDKDFEYNNGILKYNNKEYKYLTIHSAKGLEEDYVILLNVSNSTYGLPNKIENHNILSYVSSKEDDYPFAEERRVFFVAITRCKFKTYLMVPKNNPSIFIEEIKKVI